ncbi:MAG: hypothetical protein ACQEXG_00155 [Pseudomonadota bacterium]
MMPDVFLAKRGGYRPAGEGGPSRGGRCRIACWCLCLWSMLLAGQLMAAESKDEAAAWQALAEGGMWR